MTGLWIIEVNHLIWAKACILLALDRILGNFLLVSLFLFGSMLKNI